MAFIEVQLKNGTKFLINTNKITEIDSYDKGARIFMEGEDLGLLVKDSYQSLKEALQNA